MISFENVSYTYGSNKQSSLKDCSFKINNGEFILLCGKSGSGKTTVTKMINGLIPNFQEGNQTGIVSIDNHIVKDTPSWELSKIVGSVFQNPKSQFFNLNTTDEIVFGMENIGVSHDIMEKRLADTVEKLQIQDLLNRNLFRLSGGQKQKIAIASVYAMGGDIILLDEPSSNLDIQSMKQLAKMLEILKSQGKTIIIAEHRFWYITDLIDRVFYFDSGVLKLEMNNQEFKELSESKREELGLRQISRKSVELSIPKCEYNHKDNLCVKDLTISYGKSIIQKNVSFSVNKEDIVAILGSNGVGKSSLTRCLCGLIKQKSGEIFLNGQELSAKKRQKLSFLIMQDVNYQLFSDSVIGEAMLGNASTESDAKKVLSKLGLEGFENSHPMALSGGQAQRLAIADGYLCNKDIIIFDEPTSGLDYDGMVKVSNLIKSLSKDGKIVLIVTHDEELVSRTCNKILTLN